MGLWDAAKRYPMGSAEETASFVSELTEAMKGLPYKGEVWAILIEGEESSPEKALHTFPEITEEVVIKQVLPLLPEGALDMRIHEYIPGVSACIFIRKVPYGKRVLIGPNEFNDTANNKIMFHRAVEKQSQASDSLTGPSF